MTRVRIPPAVDRDLRSFYGKKQCVVTLNDLNAEWHHLDEDNRNSIFQNLIPLERNLNWQLHKWNKQLTQYKDGRQPNYGFQFNTKLEWPNLLTVINNHKLAGRYSSAYGCCRLGAFIIRKYHPILMDKDPERVWEFIIQSLYFLPYCMDERLLIDVLKRDVLNPNSKEYCSSKSKIKILHLIANILQDYGEYDSVNELHTTIRKLRDHSNTSTRSDQSYASLLRRMAINAPETARDRRLAISRLNEAEQIAQGSHDFYVSVQNAKSWNYINGPNPDSVNPLDSIEQLFKKTNLLEPSKRTNAVFLQNLVEVALGYGYFVQSRSKTDDKRVEKARQGILEVSKMIDQVQGKFQMRPFVTQKKFGEDAIKLLVANLNTPGFEEKLIHTSFIWNARIIHILKSTVVEVLKY